MKTKNGSALLFATILLFVVLSMVVSLTYVTVMEQKMSGRTKSSVGAFFNADSGVEWALNKIANVSGDPTLATAFSVDVNGKAACPDFGSGSPCSIYFLGENGEVLTSGNVSDIKAVRAVGTQGGETQRAIEAAVAQSVESGAYVSFKSGCSGNSCCLPSFINKGSLGNWGICHWGFSTYAFYRPPGSSCPSGWSSAGTGEQAFLCAGTSGETECYVSYMSGCSGNDCCLSEFTNKGSLGFWGYCNWGSWAAYRPEGAGCPGGWSSGGDREAYLCCK